MRIITLFTNTLLLTFLNFIFWVAGSLTRFESRQSTELDLPSDQGIYTCPGPISVDSRRLSTLLLPMWPHTVFFCLRVLWCLISPSLKQFIFLNQFSGRRKVWKSQKVSSCFSRHWLIWGYRVQNSAKLSFHSNPKKIQIYRNLTLKWH